MSAYYGEREMRLGGAIGIRGQLATGMNVLMRLWGKGEGCTVCDFLSIRPLAL